MEKNREGYNVLNIVVTYKSCEYINTCLRALTNQTYRSHKILVVDNRSEDNIEENIRKFNGVQLLKNEKNHGYAYAVNQGLKRALKDDAEFAFILNPDIEMDSRVLEKLVTCAEQNPKIGAIGPNIIQMSWSNAENLNNLSSEEGIVYVDWLSGCGILVRMEAVKQIGLFDPDYFLYWEETDFLFRLKKGNWKIAKVNSAIMKHVGGASSKYIKTKSYYYFIRNIFVFARKNISPQGHREAIKIIMRNLWDFFHFPMHPLRFMAYISAVFVGTIIYLFPKKTNNHFDKFT